MLFVSILFSGIIVVDKLTSEVTEMVTITLSDILDDLRVADQALRRFEQRYWISSDVFYELYSQGLLDDGVMVRILPSGLAITSSSERRAGTIVTLGSGLIKIWR